MEHLPWLDLKVPHISRHCGRIVNDNIIYVFTAESDDRRILKSSLNV